VHKSLRKIRVSTVQNCSGNTKVHITLCIHLSTHQSCTSAIFTRHFWNQLLYNLVTLILLRTIALWQSGYKLHSIVHFSRLEMINRYLIHIIVLHIMHKTWSIRKSTNQSPLFYGKERNKGLWLIHFFSYASTLCKSLLSALRSQHRLLHNA